MALETFVLQPSADIHVTSAQTIQVQVIGFDIAGAAVANPINGQCTFTMADTSIATVTAGGLVSRVATGITFMTVEHTTTNLKLVARIWAHDALQLLFLGNNRGSVNVDTDNFQAKMVATFADPETEDVTGHPYTTYESLSPGLFSVDTTGRVTGIATGNGSLRIKDAAGATLGDIPITVRDSLSTDRPIAEPVTLKGTGEDKRNILFLAEGFTAAEEAEFRRMARHVNRKMRTSRLHEPFRILSNDYNTWLAFMPSEEPGVSIGPELLNASGDMGIELEDVAPNTATNFSLFQLIDLVGYQTAEQQARGLDLATARTEWASIPGFTGARLEPDIFRAWRLNTRIFTPTLDKDTPLGFMYGQRLGDRIATTGTPSADNKWYRELPANAGFFYKDVRRTGSDRFADNSSEFFHNAPQLPQHWSNETFTLLASLKRSGASAGDPLFDIGQRWGLDGPDQGLVMVIVNDDVHAANYHLMPTTLGFVSAGKRNSFPAGSLSTDVVVDHTPSPSHRFLASLVSHVTHELCHGIFLGDEYEDIREAGNHSFVVPAPPATPTPAQVAKIESIEIYHNVQTRAMIDREGLKWTWNPRFVRSSALLSAAVINQAAGTIECELFPGEGSKWSVGDSALLLTKNLNGFADIRRYQLYNSHAHLRNFGDITSKSGDTVTIGGLSRAPGPDEVFPKGSILTQFGVHNSQLVTLTLPGVVNWMNTAPATVGSSNQPAVGRFLTDKGTGGARSCDTPNRALVNTPHPIPNVRIARGDRHWLVGAHEGAETFNCDVVRPSAVCKMRQEYWYPRGENRGHFRFCHVCRYMIVQEFNGSRHVELDRLYPGAIV